MKPIPYKNALVLGLGVSGIAAAELLLGEGTSVTVIDAAGGADVEERAETLRQSGATVLTGAEELPPSSFDVSIVSPGIPTSSGWVTQLEERGVEVISELELGGRRCLCPCLAVTGTNGKSTLTKLCAEALGRAGNRTAAVGNYGIPLCRLAHESGELDWAVVEVSSFQLERTTSFHPSVSVLLNVQPDHLDRHADMDSYMRTKARLFDNMTAGDKAVVPVGLADDLDGILGQRVASPDRVTFGTATDADVQYAAGKILFRGAEEDAAIDLSGTRFANPVLGLTAAAAAAAIRACGSDPRILGEVCRTFEPLPHRMTPVGEQNGVIFVDDSKATNLSALAAALQMVDRPVRLIAGGLLKEGDLKSVQEILVKKVRALYVIGESAVEMEAAWGGSVPCRQCETLERAVREARRDARQGETVLLSPGCASYDQFRNFEDRGNQFIQLVRSFNEET